jgi:phosphatidylcholine synthase
VATPIACAMLVASGFGFSRLDAKTADHFFTGFPSYWNIVVLYLFELGWTAWTNALILLAFTALVFVPIRFLYPSRTPVWPILMNGLGAVWGAAILAIAWCHPDAPRWLVQRRCVSGAVLRPVTVARVRPAQHTGRPRVRFAGT